MVTYKDLVEQAKKLNLPKRSKYRTNKSLIDAIEIFKNVSLPNENFDTLKVTGLRRYASKHNVPGWSKARDRKSLLKLLKSYQGQRPVPAPRRPRPVPAPRNILDLPNPKINVPLLMPVKKSLPPQKVEEALEETGESVIGWLDWLEKAEEKVDNTSSVWKKLKKSVESF